MQEMCKDEVEMCSVSMREQGKYRESLGSSALLFSVLLYSTARSLSAEYHRVDVLGIGDSGIIK
jgi:hypothetical protein